MTASLEICWNLKTRKADNYQFVQKKLSFRAFYTVSGPDIYLNQTSYITMAKLIHFKSYKLCTLVFILLFCTFTAYAQPDTFKPVSAKKSGVLNPWSPDPAFNYKWADPKATDELEVYPLYPVSRVISRAGSFKLSDLKNDGNITVMGTGDIRFDFGRTNAAWLEFDSDDLEDSVTLSISEYNEPAIVNTGALNRVKTLAPVRHGHTYRLELNPDLYEGVRFGWLHVLRHTHTWHLRNLHLECQVKPVNYQGSFACSDPEFTRIWYTGAYTVKLNLQKDYFGAILMERSDRHSWTGDAYPSQAASMVAFGNFDFVKQNLINTSGLNNDIESYSMYWVLSLIDYVKYTGDLDFARRYMGNAAAKLDSAYRHYGEQHRLGFYGWDERLGAGFENPDNPESQHAYTMLTIRAWLEFGQLMKQIGEGETGNKYIGYATSKIEAERKGKAWPNGFGLHASADAINTGLTTPEENSLFYTLNYTDRVNRLSYSPFNEYFIIGALGKMNRYADALSSIRDCWYGQLRYGGTTFFEVYRPSWNSILSSNDAPPNNQCGYTSLTHPWSAGVVKWLSEEVAGIKPLEPGFKTFEIIPHLSTSLAWVKGSTPTPKGLIKASFNILNGRSSFTIPGGTIARRIAIPIGENSIQTVYLNNKLLGNQNDYTIAAGYLYLKNVRSGEYICKLGYMTIARHLIPVKNKAWHYPVNKITQDSLTHGNWKAHYGKAGYVLFNYRRQGSNVQRLPVYLKAITLKNAGDIHIDRPDLPSTNNGLLSDSAGNQQQFGAIITKDPQATLQTMTVNLEVSDNKKHRVALYFSDWDSQSRRTVIELFNLKTLNLIAPVQLVKNYQQGKYLVFECTGSIRIRINQVRGKNAAVSGVFFD